MSYLRVALGPAPCRGCGQLVMWVRTFTGLELRSVRYSVDHKCLTRPHECKPELWTHAQA